MKVRGDMSYCLFLAQCPQKNLPAHCTPLKISVIEPGGYLTRLWTGTCHQGFKNIPVPYTKFSKMYTRLYTNFPKMYTRPYTNCENCENRYRSLSQNRENRYPSLYQNRENRYPSRWHVPVPKICIVPPPPPG